MTDPAREGLGRACQELAAADLLADHGFHAPAVSPLRGLLRRRGGPADYELSHVPAEEARAAVADARFVVEAVEEWIRDHPA